MVTVVRERKKALSQLKYFTKEWHLHSFTPSKLYLATVCAYHRTVSSVLSKKTSVQKKQNTERELADFIFCELSSTS